MSVSAHSKDLLFPLTGTILVTGANGHLAGNVITEALALGLHVIGTVRREDSVAQLNKLFSNPNYSTVVVADIAESGAFDELAKKVDAIFLTATIAYGPSDPELIIAPTIKYIQNVATSALAAPSVKRIVYTGTIPIVFRPGHAYKQDRTTWADDMVAAAKAPPPYDPMRPFINYKAAKDLAERALYEFVKTNKPHFTVNSVLPVAIFGSMVSGPGDAVSGAGNDIPRQILAGGLPYGDNGQWYIDATDVARIHLAAAFDSTITNERFLAAADKFDWNEAIDLFQKLVPSATTLPKRLPEPVNKDLGDNDNAPGKAVLSKWWGQQEYTSFEEAIRRNLVGIAPA